MQALPSKCELVSEPYLRFSFYQYVILFVLDGHKCVHVCNTLTHLKFNSVDMHIQDKDKDSGKIILSTNANYSLIAFNKRVTF